MTTDSQSTPTLDCDLCIIGAGYAALNGLNVAAKYLSKGARVVVIDKNATWGGQWLHQYDYVRLHQPHRMFTAGDQPWNSGLDPSYLATRSEVLAHLSTVPAVSAGHLELKPLFGHEYTGHSIREGRVELVATPVAANSGAPVRVRSKRLLNAIGTNVQLLPPYPLSSNRIRSIAPVDPLLSSREFLDGDAPVYIIGSGKTATDTARHLLQPRRGRRRSVNVIAGSGMWFMLRDNLCPPGVQPYYRGTPSSYMFLQMADLYDGQNEVEMMEVLRRRGYMTTVWGFGGNCRLGMVSRSECDELRAGVERVFRGHLVDVDGTRMTLQQGSELQEHEVPEGAYFINCTTHLRPRGHQPVLQDSGLMCAPQFSLGLSGMSAYYLTHLWFRDELSSVAHKLFRIRMNPERKLAFFSNLGLMVLANMTMINTRLPLSIAARYQGDPGKWYPLYRRLPMIAHMLKRRDMVLDKAERFLKVRFSDAPDADAPAVVGVAPSSAPASVSERTFAAE